MAKSKKAAKKIKKRKQPQTIQPADEAKKTFIADKKPEKTKEPSLIETKALRFDFIGKNKYWVILSTALIIAGIIFFFIRGFNFGIDFLGGNLIEVKFKQDITITELRKEMEEIGYGKAILQSTEKNQFIIRTVPITEEQKDAILEKLDDSIGIEKPLIQDRNVAPGFSKTITRNALIAVAISVVGILIYVWIRFAVRFAVVAIIELLHDVLIIFSFYIVTFREFNTTTIAVVLTILGYSLSDAIVIFDRIREELRVNKRDSFPLIVNYSINKILVRSLSTTATTLFPVIVLLIIGNETLKDFAFGLFIGVLSGTYSSIFVGAPILIAWNNRFPKYKK
ncbi:MAG: protein translocase subunit SecF [Actinobacteria bacterium]|nr:protein translocase subunit SecF [Actinomycetota bacterium]